MEVLKHSHQAFISSPHNDAVFSHVQIDSCISRPPFSSQKQWYFLKLVYKLTPMIDGTKQNKIEGIKDKKQ